MRLGDLDALKEDFKSRLALCNEWIEKAKDKETKIRASAVKGYIAEVIMTIDNAPTVEPETKVVANVAFNKEHLEEIIEKANTNILAQIKRPQGEWEIVDAEGLKIWNCVCTECGHDPQEYIGGTEDWWLRKSHLPNFCPNCGVRIVNVKGGAE